MYLPRKFPLFFTDELRLDETDLFIFRDRFANDLSYFFIIIARRRETEEHPSARAPSFSLSLSLKSSDTKTKRNEKRAQNAFLSSAIVPTTPSERSQTLEPNFSSSSLDAEKPKNTRARAHLLFLSLSHLKVPIQKRNETKNELRTGGGLFIFRDRSDDAFGTISDGSLTFIIIAQTTPPRPKKPKDRHHHHHHHRRLVYVKGLLWETPLFASSKDFPFSILLFCAYFLTRTKKKKEKKKKKKKKRREEEAGGRRQKKRAQQKST